ncbi:protein unc-50 homolog [Spodoptera litura]|uniref:Protein unc-50 homolog n=1 Tax=Spodoptera litura TaxID=69820 RepID=A0A9J7IK41_SPOLT|nr:protein unc-50 homolog [Spodoptera litura]XP_022815850.1 protein unc-50 homolog [Spodoptera litura]
MKYSTSPTPSLSNYPRSTSPLPAPANYQPTTASAAVKRYKYIRRLFKFNQMDFEFAAWQMVYLFVSPQKVFRNFNYRKHTKSQFARDDPAFLVLLSVWLFLSSICLGLAMGLTAGKVALFVLFVVFVDFIGAGILVSTFFWYVSNTYLRRDPDGPDVEWGYAFDVHINAFFPPLSLLHFFQIVFFENILFRDGFLSCLVSNTFWLASIIYYLYITFLGYSNLPMLQNARVFLLPLPILFLTYLATLAMGWNLSEMLVYFYMMRVLH